MRYPIVLTPMPTVPDCVEARHAAGQVITHVEVIDADTAQVFTGKGSVTGSKDVLLPPKLQDLLGPVFRRATKTLGPTHRKFNEEYEEDSTYDPDSSVGPEDKPEERGRLHPKEYDALQTFHQSLPDTTEEVEVEDEFPQSLPSVHPKEIAIRKTFIDLPETEVTEVVRHRVEVGAAVKTPMDPDERAIVAVLQQFEARSKETGLRLRTAMPRTDSFRLKRQRREAIHRLLKRRIIAEGKPEHYYLPQPRVRRALGEDTMGFDLQLMHKAFDLLEKAWDPPDITYGTRDYMFPGDYIPKVAPRISKTTDFSRAMEAVCKHWIKKHPPYPKEPDERVLEDDDGTLLQMYDEEVEWWAKNKGKVLSYYKGWKFPPKVMKIVDKVVADATAFAVKNGVDEKRYIKLVADRWATDCARYSKLQDMVGNLQGALISTKNILKKKTGKDFAKEVQRRRRLNLTIQDKRSFRFKDKIQEMGGIWDKRYKEWLLPDQGSLDKAKKMIGIQAEVHGASIDKGTIRKLSQKAKSMGAGNVGIGPRYTFKDRATASKFADWVKSQGMGATVGGDKGYHVVKIQAARKRAPWMPEPKPKEKEEFGVFKWDKSGRYKRKDALYTTNSKKRAQNWADKRNDKDPSQNLVVRTLMD